MWRIIIGISLIFSSFVCHLLTRQITTTMTLLAVGFALAMWGIIQMMSQTDELNDDEPQKREYPPHPADAAAPEQEPPAKPIEKPEDKPKEPEKAAPPIPQAPAAKATQAPAREEKPEHPAAERRIAPPAAAPAMPQPAVEQPAKAKEPPPLPAHMRAPRAEPEQDVLRRTPTPYSRGLKYLYSPEGCAALKKAASCFIEGYEKGDLNAGYMLCHCYREGKGVPMKPTFVVQLAEYLVRRRYYPAYYYLAMAYREGRGAPMNLALAAEYAKKFEDLCSGPVEGVDELVRYDALISYEMQKDEPDMRTLEQLARANYKISPLPSRYSNLALPLLRDTACSAGARAELRKLLDDGCKSDDMGCYYLRGLLLCSKDNRLTENDPLLGAEYLRLAAERTGAPAALQAYLPLVHDEAQERSLAEKYRSACRWGISGLKGSDELGCLVSLHSPKHVGCAAAPEPRLVIENTNDEPVANAVVRICCIDTELDISMKIPPLAPGERYVIRPEEHRIELGERLYIEVHADKRCSRLYVRQVNLMHNFAVLN